MFNASNVPGALLCALSLCFWVTPKRAFCRRFGSLGLPPPLPPPAPTMLLSRSMFWLAFPPHAPPGGDGREAAASPEANGVVISAPVMRRRLNPSAPIWLGAHGGGREATMRTSTMTSTDTTRQSRPVGRHWAARMAASAALAARGRGRRHGSRVAGGGGGDGGCGGGRWRWRWWRWWWRERRRQWHA